MRRRRREIERPTPAAIAASPHGALVPEFTTAHPPLDELDELEVPGPAGPPSELGAPLLELPAAPLELLPAVAPLELLPAPLLELPAAPLELLPAAPLLELPVPVPPSTDIYVQLVPTHVAPNE